MSAYFNLVQWLSRACQMVSCIARVEKEHHKEALPESHKVL